MREIRFRGKVKEKGLSPDCWVEGSLVHITRTYKDECDEKECNLYQIITEDGCGFNIDESTIGQYTGLKDKNEKEIYEGDIVKIEYIQTTIEKAVIKYKGASFYGSTFADDWELDEYYEIEVIGNIYDNPELLEE